jgi:phosphoglycerol transferase MdoB-like AlkP superfamily enzyme
MWTRARFSYTEDRTGDTLGKIRIRNYTCGLAVTMVALGLYSYYVRELLASLLLFSALFLAMGLIVLGAVLAWHASMQVALWSRFTSRNAIALTLAGGVPSFVAGVNKKA